ncbi:carbon-nitrogen hydrolase family protein [Thalassotalea sp. M1531]|uniref:Carbon-nitrogen hydrolase family protein n=1 Tax=Thalassotalea algicola TaxID=2716224 RepID=A0A7Y0LCB5_9GAMM|nr:carbon-nitrogen hydrolase family protein [Thalassotalea algicola]NMP31944.1 carbon-nitrogen hydrolase family protein [Thalassotalea algicola]
MTVKLSAIQLCSVPDIKANLAKIEQQLAQLPQADEHIVVLPECCLFFGGKDRQQLTIASQEKSISQMQEGLSSLAKRFSLYLVAGSIPVANSVDTDKFANTCLMFAPNGELLLHYQKIHLFDVEVEDSEKNYLESRYTSPGKDLAVADLPFAKLGLSICYDLRFPELYRSLTVCGADIITVPAAFTRVTGKAHWQALLQARAIENQVYIVAAGQEGRHENGRETWGHSMIISPWGEILAQLPSGIGCISADYDAELIKQVRNNIPVAKHNRFKTELIHDE